MVWTRTSVAETVLVAMSDYRKEVGVRIRSLRLAQHLSQEDLAHKAGVTVKTVSRWENGRHTGYIGNVKALAEALGVDPDDIVGKPPAPLGLDQPAAATITVAHLERIEERLGQAETERDEMRKLIDVMSDRIDQQNQLLQEQSGLLAEMRTERERNTDTLERIETLVAVIPTSAEILELRRAIDGAA